MCTLAVLTIWYNKSSRRELGRGRGGLVGKGVTLTETSKMKTASVKLSLKGESQKMSWGWQKA